MSKLENLIKSKKGSSLESFLVEVPVVKTEKNLKEKLRDIFSKRKVVRRSVNFTEKEIVIFKELEVMLNIEVESNVIAKYATDLMAIEVLSKDNKKIKNMLDNIRLELYKELGDVL